MATKNPPRVIIAAARAHIARIQGWVAGIQGWVAGMDSDCFAADKRTRYACERAFIALGEALNDLAGKIDLNALVPGGPWADAVRFRHFLAHDYDDRTIPPLLWDTIRFELPEMEAGLSALEAALRKR